jgi:cyclic pyranopterin phosphate synthase
MSSSIARAAYPVIRRAHHTCCTKILVLNTSRRSFDFQIRNLSGKRPTDSTELHQSYHDQLKELEDERINVFGSNESSSQSSASSISTKDMTLEEMNQNREAMYAFTVEEKTAWGSSASKQALSSEFLVAVKKAKEANAEYEQTLEEGMEDKRRAIVEEAEHHMLQMEKSEKVGENVIIDNDESDQPFTHLNNNGDQVSMVDVGNKEVTRRVAVARSSVVFPPEVMNAFGITKNGGNHEMIGKKGPIFSTARLAGIMGAKRTSDLIPLCHPLPLEKVNIEIMLEGNRALIECECCVTHKTGVEMEALVGASIAALTIYDMVKAVSHKVRIESTELVTKHGGKRTIEDGIEK